MHVVINKLFPNCIAVHFSEPNSVEICHKYIQTTKKKHRLAVQYMHYI